MQLTSQRGAIPVKLDRERILFYDLAATERLVERFGAGFLGELYTAKPAGDSFELKLRSVRVLAFFVWVGLERDAAERGEELTIATVELMFAPLRVETIFNATILALAGTVLPPPGKAEAASPAAKRVAKQPAKQPTETTRRKR